MSKEIEKQKDLIDSWKWDVLIILDAMRFDIFEELNTIPGKLRPVWSAGSWTIEWFTRTFPEEKYDIWLVSPSPMLQRMARRDKMKFDKVSISRELRTAPAHFVSQQALTHIGERMIIHYMQPHFPAIGETKLLRPLPFRNRARRRAGERPLLNDRLQELVQKGVINSEQADAVLKKVEAVEPTANEVERKETVVRAYRDNAKYVIGEVEKLIPLLKGNVIISADHGTRLGEGGRFGHGGGRDDPILKTVPWLEVKIEQSSKPGK